jgi:ribonuclease-3
MKELLNAIGYTFHNEQLLLTAMTCPSFSHEKSEPDNQRLEFLGDSLLGFLTAFALFQDHPNLPEGELTRTRAMYVCEKTLVQCANRLGIGQYLRLGKGDKDGRERPSTLADAMEALMAAIYLDGGLVPSMNFIRQVILSHPPADDTMDYKSLYQETVQSMGKMTPVYTLIEETGPDHNKAFHMAVIVGNVVCGTGTGQNKKTAQQKAAQQALEHLDLLR